ncbi:V-type proton ATPase subunit S1b [Diretmus argenteus]
MAGRGCSSEVRSMAFIALLFAFFATGSSTAQVPLLMWSSDGLPPLAPPAAGHIVSSGQLTTYLDSAFDSDPHTVLLFLQDKLSKDDFTVFGGVFGNKQDSAFQNLEAALRSSASSLVLPALEWPGSSTIPALLQEKLGVSPLLVDKDTLSHLNLNVSDSSFLIINLPYCTGLPKSCKEVLHENDEVIGEVLRIMKAKNVPYTAIYTGLQPSRVISEQSVFDQPMGRSLLQAPDVKPPIMFSESNTVCIMLWAENLNVSFTPNSGWTDLAALTPTLEGSQCNDTNAFFSMSQKFYPVSARQWFILDTVQLRSRDEALSLSGNRSIYAPAEYSFHCQFVSSFEDALLVPINANLITSQWRINLIDLQIQGFGVGNGTFSYASDCAGFFTAGIWMGLLTSLLMLLILIYGLHMIMQLNTMDRFDDPKGPTISVPQSE